MKQADLDAHSVKWNATDSWVERLQAYPRVLTALKDEKVSGGGIRRAFVHGYADSDEVELFLVAMAWGFGSRVRGKLQKAMLGSPPRAKIRGIVDAVQLRGALAGWNTLFDENTRISGLGCAFGTKLLYFAAYNTTTNGPRPLILDSNVRIALLDAGTGICADSRKVLWQDYVEYLELAQRWGEHHTWQVTPEVAEYTLFERSKRLVDWQNERRKARKDGEVASTST